MRLLFITDKDVNLKSSGVQVMTNRNYNSFLSLFGELNTSVAKLEYIYYPSKLSKFISYLRGYNEFLNKRRLKEIVREASNYDYVVLDFSIWGVISKQLNKNNYRGKIICFFHNVEFMFLKQEFNLFNIYAWILLPNTYYNEKLSCKYSDIVISLNQRDANNIKRLYGRTPHAIIPFSMEDQLKSKEIVNRRIVSPFNVLFVGSYFWANINGLKWFVNEVLKYLSNVRFTIVGNGMKEFEKLCLSKDITIFDRVDDLSPFYEDADFLVSPIFEGSGMKAKTAEGLMYGKNIVGTPEAFVGYEIEYEKVGMLCETKEDFIHFFKFEAYKFTNSFNQYSREQFLKKYSFDSTVQLFKDILNI